jgi:hypothetical protein
MSGRTKVVEIFCDARGVTWTGTGFFISESIIITTYHLLFPPNEEYKKDLPSWLHIRLEVVTKDTSDTFKQHSITSGIKIVAGDPELDWVALKIAERSFHPYVWNAAVVDDSDVGRRWSTYGFAGRSGGLATSGEIASVEVVEFKDTDRPLARIQLNSRELAARGEYRGLSGAPVIVGEHVVGLITEVVTPSVYSTRSGEPPVAGGTLLATPIDQIVITINQANAPSPEYLEPPADSTSLDHPYRSIPIAASLTRHPPKVNPFNESILAMRKDFFSIAVVISLIIASIFELIGLHPILGFASALIALVLNAARSRETRHA